jgi:hypothetical protein
MLTSARIFAPSFAPLVKYWYACKNTIPYTLRNRARRSQIEERSKYTYNESRMRPIKSIPIVLYKLGPGPVSDIAGGFLLLFNPWQGEAV